MVARGITILGVSEMQSDQCSSRQYANVGKKRIQVIDKEKVPMQPNQTVMYLHR